MSFSQASRELVGNRYRLGSVIGRGGFGIVWRAQDTLLGRPVAVKEILIPAQLDEGEQARLRKKVLREARACARLSDPGAVTVYDVVDEDERTFIVMELIEAPSLAELVREHGPRTPAEAAEIGLELLKTVQAAHAQGIIHRDIKPGNVLVPTSGPPRLADFGIASIVDEPSITTSGLVPGSPSFMSPEQASGGEIGPSTDLWSLGATLYFAVEGEAPFDKGGAIPTMLAIVNDELRPPFRAGALRAVLEALLTKDPAARASASEVSGLLEDAIASAPARADPDLTMPLPAGMAEPASGPASFSPPEPPPGPQPPPRAEPPPEPASTAPAVPATPSEPVPVPSRPPRERVRTPPAEAPPASAPPAPPQPPAWGPPPPAQPPPRLPPSPPAAPYRSIPGEPGRLARGVSRHVPIAVAAVAVVAVGVALFAALLVPGGGSPRTASPAPSSSARASAQPSTQGSPGQAGVPKSWVAYTDPATGFTIARPPAWGAVTNGTRTDFKDPAAGAYLRVDHIEPPGPSAVGAWQEQEKTFSAQHANYQRLRLEPASYQGFPAAVWEFRYADGGALLHAQDLGFITGRYGFALYFQTRDPDWQRLQPVFESFKSSFRAPA